MSSHETLDRAFAELVRTIALKLKDRGFTRNGVKLQVKSDRNFGIIEFQRSTSSSAEGLRFTVNLGIILGDLLDRSTRTPGMMFAHVRQRLGHLMPDPSDRWWQLDAATQVDTLAGELASALIESGVPFIERYLKTQEVVSLWESGRSPGLTETQRNRLLTRLKTGVKS